MVIKNIMISDYWQSIFYIIIVILIFREASSGIALGAYLICNRIAGLTWQQREMCRTYPDAMVAVGDGIRLATNECQHQFYNHRWNCTAVGRENTFGRIMVVGSREAAYTYAISSAGITYSITSACSRGNITTCGCDMRYEAGGKRYLLSSTGWKWAGCSVDIGHGMKFTRKFLDSKEYEGDARSLMNLHNNKAGRRAVKTNLRTECKCHGVSGSCTMKTCWKTLPPFRVVGDFLMDKYRKARSVSAIPTKKRNSKSNIRSLELALRKPRAITALRNPKKTDLVYLEPSPNYCERNINIGSAGTTGRYCNRTSSGMDGCDIMCCGRGYNTHQFTNNWKCGCKFIWCCNVKCDTCIEKKEHYTCK